MSIPPPFEVADPIFDETPTLNATLWYVLSPFRVGKKGLICYCSGCAGNAHVPTTFRSDITYTDIAKSISDHMRRMGMKPIPRCIKLSSLAHDLLVVRCYLNTGCEDFLSHGRISYEALLDEDKMGETKKELEQSLYEETGLIHLPCAMFLPLPSVCLNCIDKLYEILFTNSGCLKLDAVHDKMEAISFSGQYKSDYRYQVLLHEDAMTQVQDELIAANTIDPRRQRVSKAALLINGCLYQVFHSDASNPDESYEGKQKYGDAMGSPYAPSRFLFSLSKDDDYCTRLAVLKDRVVLSKDGKSCLVAGGPTAGRCRVLGTTFIKSIDGKKKYDAAVLEVPGGVRFNGSFVHAGVPAALLRKEKNGSLADLRQNEVLSLSHRFVEKARKTSILRSMDVKGFEGLASICRLHVEVVPREEIVSTDSLVVALH